MSRPTHLEEMRYMVAHGCRTLEEARTGLARLRWQAAEAGLAKVRGDDPAWQGADTSQASDESAIGTVKFTKTGPQYWWQE